MYFDEEETDVILLHLVASGVANVLNALPTKIKMVVSVG